MLWVHHVIKKNTGPIILPPVITHHTCTLYHEEELHVLTGELWCPSDRYSGCSQNHEDETTSLISHKKKHWNDSSFEDRKSLCTQLDLQNLTFAPLTLCKDTNLKVLRPLKTELINKLHYCASRSDNFLGLVSILTRMSVSSGREFFGYSFFLPRMEPVFIQLLNNFRTHIHDGHIASG
jgi:hypothetical protein